MLEDREVGGGLLYGQGVVRLDGWVVAGIGWVVALEVETLLVRSSLPACNFNI